MVMAVDARRIASAQASAVETLVSLQAATAAAACAARRRPHHRHHHHHHHHHYVPTTAHPLALDRLQMMASAMMAHHREPIVLIPQAARLFALLPAQTGVLLDTIVMTADLVRSRGSASAARSCSKARQVRIATRCRSGSSRTGTALGATYPKACSATVSSTTLAK